MRPGETFWKTSERVLGSVTPGSVMVPCSATSKKVKDTHWAMALDDDFFEAFMSLPSLELPAGCSAARAGEGCHRFEAQ